MTRYEVELNYNQAVSQANILEELAERINAEVVNDLDDSMGQLRNVWQSENIYAFEEKTTVLKEKISASYKKLKLQAESIRKVAKNIYDAEMEAIRIAEERAIREAEEAARAAQENANKQTAQNTNVSQVGAAIKRISSKWNI